METSCRVVTLKEPDTVPSLDLDALLWRASTLLLIFSRFLLKPQGSLLSAWSIQLLSKLPKQATPRTS